MKILKMLVNILLILGIIFLLWIFWSWAEIVFNNLNPNPVYNTYNFFEILLKTY